MKRHFWYAMTYTCDVCGHSLQFLLEDGCEGPRQAHQSRTAPKGHPLAGQTLTTYTTPGGREVVPVPLVAGKCPNCSGGTVKGHFGTHESPGELVHRGPDRQADLAIEDAELTTLPHFTYPSRGDAKRALRSGAPGACGSPHIPTRHRDTT
jgi:hypothetical protein